MRVVVICVLNVLILQVFGSYSFPTQERDHCETILSLEECRAFAGSNIEVSRFSGYRSPYAPRGCYIWTGPGVDKNVVYYNSQGRSSCTSDRQCICAANAGSTSDLYIFPTTKTGTCGDIMSEQECRTFAAENQAVTRFNSYKSPRAPRGCYIWTGAGGYKNEVYYNAAGTRECTNWRQCICKTERERIPQYTRGDSRYDSSDDAQSSRGNSRYGSSDGTQSSRGNSRYDSSDDTQSSRGGSRYGSSGDGTQSSRGDSRYDSSDDRQSSRGGSRYGSSGDGKQSSRGSSRERRKLNNAAALRPMVKGSIPLSIFTLPGEDGRDSFE